MVEGCHELEVVARGFEVEEVSFEYYQFELAVSYFLNMT